MVPANALSVGCCSWLTAVTWDGLGEGGDEHSRKCVWDVAAAKAHAPKPVAEPLPSDARFRQDLQALKARPSCCA